MSRSSPTSDWSDVPGRLATLATHEAVFGSTGHRWRLEPPLRLDELARLEEQLRVTLPEEYREFLLQVSRGGAGPEYGLFPLREVDGEWAWEGDGADLTDLGSLARPFAHSDAVNPADGLPPRPVPSTFASTEEFNRAEDAYWEVHDAVVFAPEHTVGLLYLCHLGCAYREALVVSGEARGEMWADDTASGSGFRPLLDHDGRRLGFARWYRRWLDRAEAQAILT